MVCTSVCTVYHQCVYYTSLRTITVYNTRHSKTNVFTILHLVQPMCTLHIRAFQSTQPSVILSLWHCTLPLCTVYSSVLCSSVSCQLSRDSNSKNRSTSLTLADFSAIRHLREVYFHILRISALQSFALRHMKHEWEYLLETVHYV